MMRIKCQPLHSRSVSYSTTDGIIVCEYAVRDEVVKTLALRTLYVWCREGRVFFGK